LKKLLYIAIILLLLTGCSLNNTTIQTKTEGALNKFFGNTLNPERSVIIGNKYYWGREIKASQ